MNIDKLKKGDMFKNYKELCRVLEMQVKSGKAKQIQLDKLSKLVDFNKEGNKFIVANIKSCHLENDENLRNVEIATVTDDSKLIPKTVLRVSENKDNAININTEKSISFGDNFLPTFILDNLAEGMYIKNYTELCKVLEMQYSTKQNIRIKQLNELSIYVNYTKGIKKNGERGGNGIVINKILSTNYINLDKDYKYFNNVRDIFLQYWLKSNSNNYYYNKDLFAIANVCNMDYFINSDNKGKFSKQANIDLNTIEDFFNISNRKITNALVSSLNRMYSKGLLTTFKRSYQVLTEDNEYRPTTEEEEEVIQFAVYRALEEYKNPKTTFVKGFGKDAEVKVERKYNRNSTFAIPSVEIGDFTSYVLNLIQKEFPNIIKYYPCYLIKFNTRSCQDYLKNYDINKQANVKLNDTIYNSLLKTFAKNSKLARENKTCKSSLNYAEARKNEDDYINLTDINIKLD